MNYNHWLKSFSLVVVAGLSFVACNKIITTDIGNGLIPPVDNVNTFEETLALESSNAYYEDSVWVSYSQDHALGTIQNDPLFGKTTASILAQFKPAAYGAYPFAVEEKADIIIDSIVLQLSYTGAVGDTNLLQKIRIFKADANGPFLRDTLASVAYPGLGEEIGMGSGMIDMTKIKDSVTVVMGKDTGKINNVVRLHLDPAKIGTELLNYTKEDAYKSDSAFNVVNKGIILVTDSTYGSNGLMNFNLANTNTAMYVHYRYTKDNVADTTVAGFYFGSASANANFIRRTHTGSIVDMYVNNGFDSDSLVFIQALPGTYSMIKIPELGNLDNRIIHKAELIIETITDPSDATFAPPSLLYLDANDVDGNYDFISILDPSFYSSGTPQIGLFGGTLKTVDDKYGNKTKGYAFDLTRYVQMIVTNKTKNFPLRLTAPNIAVNLFSAFNYNPATNFDLTVIANYNQLARGRVQLGGGTHSQHTMRLRIIYSKI